MHARRHCSRWQISVVSFDKTRGAFRADCAGQKLRLSRSNRPRPAAGIVRSPSAWRDRARRKSTRSANLPCNCRRWARLRARADCGLGSAAANGCLRRKAARCGNEPAALDWWDLKYRSPSCRHHATHRRRDGRIPERGAVHNAARPSTSAFHHRRSTFLGSSTCRPPAACADRSSRRRPVCDR
jgi:hypothetical protein